MEEQKRKFRRRKDPATRKTERISLLMLPRDRDTILDFCESDPLGRPMNTILLDLILRGIAAAGGPAPQPAAEAAGRTQDAPAASASRGGRKPEEPGAAARRRKEGELLKAILPPEDLAAYNAETGSRMKGAYKRAVLEAHAAGTPLPRFAEWRAAREREGDNG